MTNIVKYLPNISVFNNNTHFFQKYMSFKTKKVLAASLKRSKHGLGRPKLESIYIYIYMYIYIYIHIYIYIFIYAHDFGGASAK